MRPDQVGEHIGVAGEVQHGVHAADVKDANRQADADDVVDHVAGAQLADELRGRAGPRRGDDVQASPRGRLDGERPDPAARAGDEHGGASPGLDRRDRGERRQAGDAERSRLHGVHSPGEAGHAIGLRHDHEIGEAAASQHRLGDHAEHSVADGEVLRPSPRPSTVPAKSWPSTTGEAMFHHALRPVSRDGEVEGVQ